MKAEELRKAQEMRRNYRAEGPVDMVDSRITPIQFNTYSFREKSTPGWKRRQTNSSRKYQTDLNNSH